MRKNTWLLLVLCLSLAIASGCTTVKNNNASAGGGIRYDDATLKTTITSALLKETPTALGKVNVYVYKGHVFLVGEAEDAFRRQCYTEVMATKGVVDVTMHWFEAGISANTDAQLRNTILGYAVVTPFSNDGQLSVDVVGGQVVLTGYLPTRSDVDAIVSKIKATAGIKRVTSYIMSAQ